jgi:membrane protease YdiL (CAAX protease family)
MDKLDIKRVTVYLLIAFGFSWTIALIIYLNGGLANSRPVAPGSLITWAVPLLVLYMLGPALANIGARLATGEGKHNLWLRPKLRQGWKYWLIPWLLTPLFVLAGGVLFFLIFPGFLNMNAVVGSEIPGLPALDLDLPGWALALVLIAGAALTAPIISALPILGEEFGWRAYLQPKLLPLGQRKMYLLVGIIWGAWHWPVIWMGFNYPGYPLLGSLAMLWFTFVVGTFLGWATLRGGSVWPAVIGHGSLNGVANIWLLFIVGKPNPLLGPLAVGVIGSIGFTLATLLIMWKAQD